MVVEKNRESDKSALRRLLRSAKSAIVCAAIAASTASPLANRTVVPLVSHMIFNKPPVVMALDLPLGYVLDGRAAKLYDKKNSSWDINGLERLQKEYYEFLKQNKDATVTNNVPNALLRIMPIVREVAREKEMDPYDIAAVIEAESFGYPYAVGLKEHELGLMQINLKDCKNITKEQYAHIFDPRTNIEIGASILKADENRFHNLKSALFAYNAGTADVQRRRIPKETIAYANGVMAHKRDIMQLVGATILAN